MPIANMPNANTLKDACYKLRINPSTFSDDQYDDNLMEKKFRCMHAPLQFFILRRIKVLPTFFGNTKALSVNVLAHKAKGFNSC